MERPNENEYAAFYAYYINLVPEGNVIELMRTVHLETQGRTTMDNVRKNHGSPWPLTPEKAVALKVQIDRLVKPGVLRSVRQDTTLMDTRMALHMRLQGTK